MLKLSDFKRGWLVGNFEPSLFNRTDVEVAVKPFVKGETEPTHKHPLTTEYTLIISGKARMNDTIINAGEIFELPPDTYCDFEAMEDGVGLCLRPASIKGDKVNLE